MKGLLVRVGADQSDGGGKWNGPMRLATRQFAYVPIPETKEVRSELATPYTTLLPALLPFGRPLPPHLGAKGMHLDPDFRHGTYGDRSRKGAQISSSVNAGDLIAFYSGLRDSESDALVYAIIGMFVVDRVVKATSVSPEDAHRNAHTRRVLASHADDVIVIARPEQSGRLARCIPIGEYRNGAYRVRTDLLQEWGGLSCADGFIQRSAVFPRLGDATKFWDWWKSQDVELIHENNPK